GGCCGSRGPWAGPPRRRASWRGARAWRSRPCPTAPRGAPRAGRTARQLLLASPPPSHTPACDSLAYEVGGGPGCVPVGRMLVPFTGARLPGRRGQRRKKGGQRGVKTGRGLHPQWQTASPEACPRVAHVGIESVSPSLGCPKQNLRRRVDTSGRDATVRFSMLPTDAERPIAGQLTLLQWADLPRGAGTSSARRAANGRRLVFLESVSVRDGRSPRRTRSSSSPARWRRGSPQSVCSLNRRELPSL